MANLNIIDQIRYEEKRLKTPEEILGKGAMMPFNHTNSGSRKIMYSTQVEHVLGLSEPEVALVQTGIENQFGEFSSSFIQSDDDYEVLCKIGSLHKYYIIIKNKDNLYGVIERIQYNHITESYGYVYNNEYLDNLKAGDVIPKGKVIKQSKAFDEYGNRRDGVNLSTTYLSTEYNKEDGILISDTAAWKLRAPLLKQGPIIINDNDIPLNIYGDDNVYKSFPDIGEEIKDGVFCALRREKKEESLFTQSKTRLKEIMMSDEKYPLQGVVLDIKVYCNNPEILDEMHFSQIKKYYNAQNEFNRNFVNVVKPIIDSGYKCSYELQKIYSECSKSLSGTQYLKDRVFSNIILEFTIMQEKAVDIGDKMSNRYGGKGVVSIILPEHMMPRLDNGKYAEVIFNSSTCVNRENAGQLFESSINHISARIIDYINLNVLDSDQIIGEYLKFISLLSSDEGNYIKQIISKMDNQAKIEFIDTLSKDIGFIVSMLPLSDTMSVDKLAELYEAFPYATQHKVTVPITDSMGNIRYVPARRKLVVGSQYIYRLKQYAEEKFSAVSLSATNLKNENSRNSSKKNYKSIHSRTPIKFGEMEIGDLMHLGAERVVENLMLYSASPHGRRLAEQILTGDPFDIDIRLDDTAKNRSVEIMNAYLLTMGLELVITKRRRKQIRPISKYAITKIPSKKGLQQCITKINFLRDCKDIAEDKLKQAITKL